eukprot:6335648-Amphidinium_carterae.1
MIGPLCARNIFEWNAQFTSRPTGARWTKCYYTALHDSPKSPQSSASTTPRKHTAPVDDH